MPRQDTTDSVVCFIGERDEEEDEIEVQQKVQKRAKAAQKRKETIAAKIKGGSRRSSGPKAKSQRIQDNPQYGLKRTSGQMDGDLDDGEQKKFRSSVTNDEENNQDAREVVVVKKGADEIIVVAIDVGTTYSTFAWVSTTGKKDLSSINLFKDWPKAQYPGVLEKTKSIIALVEENPSLTRDECGYAVRAGRRVVAWFKLHFATEGELKESDDPLLRTALSKGMMRIPEGMNPVEIMGRMYGYLWGLFQADLTSKSYTEEEVRTTAIKAVLTVPASYLDDKRKANEIAAHENGVGPRAWDNIVTLSEPEAAAIYAITEVIEKGRADKFFPKGSGVIVVDIGGGSIDVAVVEILRTDPTNLKVVIVPDAGYSGATSTTRAFADWCLESFGDAFESLDSMLTDAASDLMTEFENKMKGFTGADEDEDDSLLKLPELGDALKTAGISSERYDEIRGRIVIDTETMKSFFNTVLTQTEALVGSCFTEIETQNLSLKIKTLVLCGGLALCPYVESSLRELCISNGFPVRLQFYRPKCPWAAVAYGAAIYGAMPHILQDRPSAIHFGCAVTRKWIAGEHSASMLHDCPSRGPRATGFFKCIVGRGEYLNVKPLPHITTYLAVVAGKTTKTSIKLYAYQGRKPKEAIERIDDEGVWHYGTIDVSYKPMGAKMKRAKEGGSEVVLRISVELLSDTGKMKVFAAVDGQRQPLADVEVDFLPGPYR